MKTKNTTTLHLRKSIDRSPLQLGFLLIPLALAWFALSSTARAADGGLSGGNTAEGTHALFSLTTGHHNTANGFDALFSNSTGSDNTASGFEALFSNTDGNLNTAIGEGALFSNTTGGDNTATGLAALFNNTDGNDNTANGFEALVGNMEGSENTAIGEGALFNNNGFNNTALGVNALFNNTTGSTNIALGYTAGSSLTVGDLNIDIGNPGDAADDATIRIGFGQTKTFIVGINGVDQGSGTAVFINTTTGQLGTAAPTSSRRFKKEIKPMDQTSEAILGLKPVTFQYKSDSKGTPQFGLIAEEVAAVNPDLVVRDAQGEIYTVRYDAVNAMLLNEFLKEHRKVREQNRRIQEQEVTINRLQKGMERVIARIEKQDSKIQKVSDKVELNRPAPQMVNNNQ